MKDRVARRLIGDKPVAGERMDDGFVNLLPGDPAPWFVAASTSNPRFTFDTVAGRYVVLCFLGSAGDAPGAAALQAVEANRDQFDDMRACFFGVTVDPADQTSGRLRESLPGIRHFWDFDRAVSKAYGAVARDAPEGATLRARRFWMVLDPTLRVLRVFPFKPDGSDRTVLFTYLRGLPPPHLFAGPDLQVPILFLPNVFEPGLCRRLIDLYEADGGEESGFMREVDGKTVKMTDPTHKRRRDYTIGDRKIAEATQMRVARRIAPEIAKVHQFHATRMERYIVACYAAEDGGHFRHHRDNTTKGTAHRRFAVSINLNDDFDGGEIGFPEYGSRGFKPPVGGAVVFSCSLLHTVFPVTRGRRYAFLPFLYDDAAAKIREANNPFLDPALEKYKALGSAG